MSKLGTTTWKERNVAHIKATRKWADKFELIAPSLLDVGPGGTINFFAGFINGVPRGATRWALKFTESALRKTGLFALVSFESCEIYNVFKDASPKKFYVIDCEEKVIAAVKKFAAGNGCCSIFEIRKATVSHLVPPSADVVFAYNVIQRTDDWQASLANLARAVNPGGLLSITYGNKLGRRCEIDDIKVNAVLSGFERLDASTYRKLPVF